MGNINKKNINVVLDGNRKDTLPNALPGVSDDDKTLDTAPNIILVPQIKLRVNEKN